MCCLQSCLLVNISTPQHSPPVLVATLPFLLKKLSTLYQADFIHKSRNLLLTNEVQFLVIRA